MEGEPEFPEVELQESSGESVALDIELGELEEESTNETELKEELEEEDDSVDYELMDSLDLD